MNQTEHEALTAIAQQMMDDATEWAKGELDIIPRDLRNFARQIETLLKMSKPTEPFRPIPAEVQHHIEIEKARAEIRAQKNGGMKASDFMPKADIEEEAVGQMVMLRGGTNHSMSVPSAKPTDPPGTHAVFGDDVYTLAVDKNFDFNEEETSKYRKARQQVK